MSTITPPPTPPSRADAEHFASRGDAFLGWFPTFVSELNAALAQLGTGTGGGTGGGGTTNPPTGGGGIGSPDYVYDYTPPPTPTGFVATPGIGQLYFRTDQPTYAVGHGHGRTVVYGAIWDPGVQVAPVFADAVILMEYEGNFSSYASNPATRWCLWAKWRTRDGVVSDYPAGGLNGSQVTTGQDVRQLLTALAGQITRSQLFVDLGAPIDSIQAEQDADAIRALAAAAATHAEATRRADALTKEALDRGTAIVDVRNVVAAGDAQLAQQIATLTAVVGGNSAAIQSESVTRASADAAEAALRVTLAAEVRDPTTGLAATRATLASNYSTIAGRDQAIATSAQQLTAAYGAADTVAAGGAVTSANNYTQSYVQSYTYSTAGVNSAISGAITTYSATVNGQIAAAVQTEAVARATDDGKLFAQYTVKLDTNGYVSGFGLASTASGASPFSSFIVRSDSFAVASPSGPGIAPATPFIVRTTAGSVNGVAYPSGVYIDAAYILDLTAPIARLGNAWIDDAKIANLSAAKLTAGDGTIGGNLKSGNFASGSTGWLIQPNGYAEFSNIIIRGATYTGTIYAGAGLIGGIVIGSAAIYSSNFVAGTSGFRIHSNGSAEFSNLYARGDIQATSLNAATGTFSGSLSAATGTFTGSLSAATGSFAGSLSAATGTFAGTLTAAAVNAVNTINIAGNAVSAGAFAAGYGGTVSTTLSVPSGQTMRIYAHATGAGAVDAGNIGGYTLTVSINGSSISGPGISAMYGTAGNEDGSQSPTYSQSPTSIAMVASVAGPATATISASTGDGRYKTISALGFLK